MYRKQAIALVAVLCGLIFPASALAGGMSCMTTHESGPTTKQINSNDQSQGQGEQFNFAPQLGYESRQFQVNQSQEQNNAQANGNNGSQNSDSQRVLWTKDSSKKSGDQNGGGTEQVNRNEQSQHQGEQFNFAPQLGYESRQFQVNQSQEQNNAQANGNNGSQNSDSQRVLWTKDSSKKSGDQNGGGTEQVNRNEQSQHQGEQVNFAPQVGGESRQFQVNQSQEQNNAQANGNNGSQNSDSQNNGSRYGDSQKTVWTKDSSTKSGDQNGGGTEQVNHNDQSQHQGEQVNFAPQVGGESRQYQVNQSQSQNNAQANGNNGSQNSDSQNNGSRYGDTQKTVWTKDSSTKSGDQNGGGTEQVNHNDQSQHQGEQVNIAPQVGFESHQYQVNQSQSQNNAQANGNNGSQNSGDPSGGPQGSGTKQVNANGQEQGQGDQINITPQVGFESNQYQVNQSQSQNNAQANGNNGSQNSNGS